MLDNSPRLSYTAILDQHLRLSDTEIFDYSRQLCQMTIQDYQDNYLRIFEYLENYLILFYTTILNHLVLNNLRQLSIKSMTILGNYEL